MKKSALLIAGLLAWGSTSMHADEGMWTLYNLPDAVYEQMVAEGFQLPCDMLYNSPDAISNYVVNFSGFCSGVVVSPDGLVFTNHHCGFSAINAHSTVEHDYMKDGFYARNYVEELPNENMFVSFMKNQQDITDRVNRLIAGKNAEQTEAAIDSLTNHMTDSVKAIDKTLHVTIDPFYEGNKYYATTYQDFPDVRLVFTVPKSMGKFGGETDNWMWPRQTCDFSVFRIYADPKTNGPAVYSKDNVPYHPAHWAPVSLEGYKDKDFAMTVGYPGSTSRYLSSYGIQRRRDIDNTTRVQVRDIKLAIMKKYMDQNEKTRIQYENKYVGSANYWKNSMGMNKCIDSIGLIRQKAEYEAKIQKWLDAKTVKDPAVSVDFAKLGKLYETSREPALAQAYWNESFWRTSEFLQRTFDLSRGAIELQGPKGDPKKQYMQFKDNSDEWNLALDKEMTAAMLKNYAGHVPARYLPDFYKIIKDKFGNDYKKYTDWVYANSKLLTKGHKFYNDEKNLKDPGIQLGVQLIMVYQAIMADLSEKEESIENEEKKLCEAKVQMEMDMPHYSDANFTMRLSYGQVGGYMIGGFNSNYYTTAESIVEKMNRGAKVEDYQAEPVMKELMSVKDFGRYADKTTGKMQLCFLTNNDITGGNSGSPMFDGKGRLIGLAFDGNWDSLSSDINFDRNLARCIGVDIRFVLYMMDKWGHADRLLKEINPQ
ncbi:MAG: S46 family peptidase [Prevotella denticola]|uniref:S46 family peptidase n=1 Tax=Prevotella denticola TaxID=28129 RepID=UPI00051023DB|nr:S46 family peptidase [Prevotella denticola]KGF43273.1 peptidase S10 [Prevotella denticola DNF00960]MBW4758898.1 S46 family peptidase [Prevotella denticola]